jgi:putative ABC transport system ATP-binding protein
MNEATATRDTEYTIEDLERVLAIATGRDAAPAIAPGADTVVVARGVTKRYGKGDAAVDALRGADVAIERGRFTAVMGPSGSGKSTLMHILAGLDTPTGGSIRIDGVEITRLRERELTKLRRDKVGFIFQSFNLLPMLSAAENLSLPLTIAGRKPDGSWLKTLVGTVGLGDRLAHRPAELSGGQQQRVAVARALVSKPAVLFADEPTGNLDSRTGGEVLDLLRRSVDEFGQTIIMVTHDAGAAAMADRVLFLKDGRIVLDRGRMTRDQIYDTIKTLESDTDGATAPAAPAIREKAEVL